MEREGLQFNTIDVLKSFISKLIKLHIKFGRSAGTANTHNKSLKLVVKGHRLQTFTILNP